MPDHPLDSGPHRFSPRPNRAHEVPWLEWGAEALERARAEDKPLLLSISAVWCHWCHVMDETSYSDPRVIELVSSRFVPVRADADVRPDIDARYNAGGWPTVALLDPDGERIAAVTYLSPEPLLDLLNRVNEAWHVSREAVEAQVIEARAHRQRGAARGGTLTPQLVAAISAAVDASFDEHFGGFSSSEEPDDAPKFPHAAALRLLLYRERRDGDPEALRHVRFSLGAMRASLLDRVEGGWFRYGAQPDWSEPHYEKLASTQAELLLTLADLARSSEADHDTALELAERTIDYVDRTLSAPNGGFYGSQDADEAYFALDAAAREEAGAPAVDDRVYAASTALLARAYLACGVVFDRPSWVSRGAAAVDFVWAQLRGGEAGLYHYWDGAAHQLGLLAPQAESLLALLDAYEVSGRSRYLQAARLLARLVDANWRPEGEAFRDVAADHDRTGLLAVPEKPLDENAALAEGLVRLGRLTHDEGYLEIAREVLEDLAGHASGEGVGAARYALAVERLLRYEPEIKIVGGPPEDSPERAADLRAEELHRAALRLALPAFTVQRLDPVADADLLEGLRLPPYPRGVAYACVGTTCSPPVDRPEALAHAIEEALSVPAL